MLFCFTAASAYDFEVDGIYYNKIGENEVEVTRDVYSGNIIIPSQVTYQDTTYSVTGIGEYAFDDCSGLTSIIIPNSVTNIREVTFSNCTGLTSITIPNSVKSIEAGAFVGCTNLKELYLGTGLRNIEMQAFADCPAIRKITCYATRVPFVEGNSFHYDVYDNADVYVPQESLNDYKSDSVWKRFYNLHGAELTGINDVTIDNTSNGEQKVYDLQGRKLQKPERGLNIINGKKVMVK